MNKEKECWKRELLRIVSETENRQPKTLKPETLKPQQKHSSKFIV